MRLQQALEKLRTLLAYGQQNIKEARGKLGVDQALIDWMNESGIPFNFFRQA